MSQKTPRDDVLAFLLGVERHLKPDQHVELYVGGGAALLAYDGILATGDVDFIGPKSGLLLEMSQLLGKGSETIAKPNCISMWSRRACSLPTWAGRAGPSR